MKKTIKKKNPLYVIKGKDVQEASSVIDLMVKKFNLTPVINFLNNIFKLLLEQVENMAMFQVVQKFIFEVIQNIRDLGAKMGLQF
jgi:hypothetical protein